MNAKNRSISTLLFLLLALIGSAHAQLAIDARAAGMGYSNAADTRGLQSVGLNPATLALRTPYNFEFNLLALTVAVNNNSLSKQQYDDYFTTGDLLTVEDKNDILNAIPAGGLRADGIVRANSLSFYMPNFSFSLVGMGSARAKIPKSVFELPLNGNLGDGRIYRFDDIKGGGWAGMGAEVSGAFSLNATRLPIEALIVGATARYIAGFRIDEIESARGEFRDYNLATNPYVELEGEMTMRSAEGGSGFGFDLGLLAQVNSKLTMGLSLQNAFSGIRWSRNTERHFLTIRADSLSLPDNISDSLITDTDTTVAIGEFVTRLPVIMDWAIAYHPAGHLTITAEFEQGLNNSMNGTRRSRAAFGLEFRGLPGIPLRTGLSFGGKTGTTSAFGIGIDLKYWYLDLAILNHGRIIPDDFKGLGVALATRLRF